MSWPQPNHSLQTDSEPAEWVEGPLSWNLYTLEKI